MAITEIPLGTVNQGNGEPLRSGGQIINDNFTDPANAASKLVQTDPTDATAEAILNNETTHIGGQINYTGANYQPFVFAGAGHVALMKNKAGGNISGGGVVDGSLLEYSLATAGGVVTTSATAGQAGQEWVNKGAVLGVDQFGMFVLRN